MTMIDGKKFNPNQLNWDDLKVNEQYLYEEGSKLSTIAELIENNSDEEFWKFKLKIIEVLGCPETEGYTALVNKIFDVSASREQFEILRIYTKISFKTKDSMPSYLFNNKPQT